MDDLRWYASCPRGLEGLLLEELQSLGAAATRETVGGVHFSGPAQIAYRVCLWSRLANRVLQPLTDFESGDSDSLYRGLMAVDWTLYLARGGSLRVDFSGSSDEIRNTRYGAQVCKDAIVDQLQSKSWPRPEVALQDPDLRLNVRLAKSKVVVAIDFSGGSLHQRGYRLEGGQAPLKENLAAALLLRADWPGIAAAGGVLIDPMCGSGTLLLEAALMVADIAPGLQRQRWGFEKLPAHDARCWDALLADANSRAERGRARQLPAILGYDADAATLSRARANIQRAGLAKVVRVTQKPLAELRKPAHLQLDRGLVIVNPPYGERLGEKESLRYLYRELGNVLSREFEGWQGAIFTSDKELGLATGLRSHKRYALYNGTLPSQLLLFNLGTESRRPPLAQGAAGAVSGQDTASRELGENAQMFANRLRKNQRRLDKWLRREGISCYRLYDADMPEYAVAVDRYGDFLHVAEYKAPAGIDPADAQRRLQEVVRALPVATGVAPERIFYKERQRQRGTRQYQKEAAQGELHTVQEGRVKLLVNFSDYLDTGLFLDHRPLRQRLAAESRGKDFLNLFCYTAAASVHACAGGARSTTSVDMSRTYLDWARKNLALNGYAENSNTLVQADCLLWMTEQDAQYDLILLDPPSFSNSRRMQQTLDIQRDQVQLLRAAMALLRPQGVLYFSNNLRSFTLADEVAEFCAVENITRQTLDPDYQRGRSGHQCWKLQHPG